jgi:bifunctional non-homologous end joining protein LigD
VDRAVAKRLRERRVDQTVLVDERQSVEAGAFDPHLEVVAAACAVLDGQLRRIRKGLFEQRAQGIRGHGTMLAVSDELELRRGRRAVRLTKLDRVWWPDEGVRKRDVVEYYRAVAPVLLPHLRNRPFTIKRHYTVPRGPFEWVKDAPPEMPDWIPVAPLPAKSRRGAIVRYPLVNDELALFWMIEYGAVDLHVWPSRADLPDRPDFVLFDLDPAGVPFGDVRRAALLLREALELLELESLVRTTGGEGLHAHVPIARRHTHAEARRFADRLAALVVRASGGLVTVERARARRHGVYVDTKMNGHGQQLVSVYSVRPSLGAAVSTPLRWEELTPSLDPAAFTMDVVLDRVRRNGDLAEPLLHGKQRLRPALARLAT